MSDPRLARPLWRGRTNVDALTIACIEHAEAIVRRRAPRLAHRFVVTQGSYQAGAGDPNSEGTHDLGGVVDLHWCRHWVCLRALRLAGTAAWHRTPAQGPWPDHVHLVVLGHPFVSAAARAQRVDYFAGRDGLADHAADDGPRLDPIPRPVWPWPPEEEDMPFLDWPEEDRAALVAAVVAGLLAAPVDDDPDINVKTALRRAGQPKETT